MSEENPLSERESLKLITEMIQKAKTGNFHESGSGSILWGSVVGIAGIMSFVRYNFNWHIGFEWWLLPLFALIPQLYLTYREYNTKLVKTHEQRALDAVWMIFGLSIFCVLLYSRIVPGVTDSMLEKQGIKLLQQNIETGEVKPLNSFALSFSSLLIIIYAFPTMVTGIVQRFKPMIAGALLCYLFFAISLYTTLAWDNLLSGFAAIFNWLIPGLILRSQYIKSRRIVDV